MAERHVIGPSEFTWYSRLATWIGAAMLLVQSVLGRDAGPVTLLSVLLLGGGFVCFLVGLAIDSHLPGTQLLFGPQQADRISPETTNVPIATPGLLEPANHGATTRAMALPPSHSLKQDAPSSTREPAASTPPPGARPARRPKFRERAKRSDMRPAGATEAVADRAEPAGAVADTAPPTDTGRGVITEWPGSASGAEGEVCPRCELPLQTDQLSACCPVCGQANHATCWMENQFHCGAPDCTGHGSLQAPAASQDAGTIRNQ